MKKTTKSLVILGSGESGVGAALLGQHLGYAVFVSDKGQVKDNFKAELNAAGIAWEEGTHTEARVLEADLIVKSPGISEKTPLVQAALQKGIPVIGEIEFGFQHAGKCRIVAITGTNGKTTTTKLTWHLLHYAGLPARMGGNVGIAFARMVLDDLKAGKTSDAERIFVLEVSSFQLDDCKKFRPQISILLNITPDHLDRYGYELENYVSSKFQIAQNQKRGDLFISNADDPMIQARMQAQPDIIPCKSAWVRAKDLRNGYVRIGQQYAFDLSSTKLKGPHNAFNAACAVRIALRYGVACEKIEEALYYFTPPAHRMELVSEDKGIRWINDSKATNVDAVYYALQAMDQPTVWIVGGQDKGNDYSPLIPLVMHRVSAIVCMGVDNSKILAAFQHLKKPMVETRSAADAVKAAQQLAEEGDTVLLSPACASFDLFKNYEDRGDQFRNAVLETRSDER